MAVRRQYLTEPGEALLLARSGVSLMERANIFAEDCGLNLTELLTPCTSAIPIPDYDMREDTGRWPSVNPVALWNPLFWMPTSVTERRTIPLGTTDGESLEYIEEDETLAARIVLICTLTGLYSPEDGSWFDVLSTIDMDVSNPDHLARLSAWIGGEEDAQLDALTLSELTDPIVAELDQIVFDSAVPTEDAGTTNIVSETHALIEDLFDPASDDALDEAAVRSLASAYCNIAIDTLPRRFESDLKQLDATFADPAVNVERTGQEFLNMLSVIVDECSDGVEQFNDMFFGSEESDAA